MLYEDMLPQLNAEYELTRGDLTGMDETEVFELAKHAYPNDIEKPRAIASKFLEARLKEKMKS